MLIFVHRLSALFFYLLASSFFVAWILMHNQIALESSATWMQITDLPLAFSAIVYGGLSVYLSLLQSERTSRTLPFFIGIPLFLFFGLILVMNFWN